MFSRDKRNNLSPPITRKLAPRNVSETAVGLSVRGCGIGMSAHGHGPNFHRRTAELRVCNTLNLLRSVHSSVLRSVSTLHCILHGWAAPRRTAKEMDRKKEKKKKRRRKKGTMLHLSKRPLDLHQTPPLPNRVHQSG